jgi:hypothetical protein
MTRPGARLRSLAQRVCDPSTMERLIEPVIADLQCEHADALRHGQVWRSRWTCIVGYLAFWKVALMTGISSTRAIRDWATADGGAVGRTIRFSGLATTVTVGILVWVPLHQSTPFAVSVKFALLSLYLLPQALSVALPMGLVFGVLCGLRGRVLKRRSRLALTMLMLATSVAVLVIDGWLLPAGNQAYRELTFGGRIPRGMNELTLGELVSKDTYQFHFRLALACAPLVLGLFSLTIATARRGRYGAPAIVLAAAAICFAYYTLLFTARETAFSGHLPAATAGWTPNLAFVALTLLLHLRRRAPSAAAPSHRDV